MPESPRTVMVVSNAVVQFADDEASLDTAIEYQCVATSAAITTTPNLQTVPATGCQGPASTPAASTFALVLQWLQDWTAAGGGLSFYAWENDTALKWFQLLPVEGGAVIAKGQVYVVAGPYLGQFGTPLLADATWPCFDKPEIVVTPPTALLAGAGAE